MTTDYIMCTFYVNMIDIISSLEIMIECAYRLCVTTLPVTMKF